MAYIQMNYFSKCLMRTVTINAIVPVDKEGNEKKKFKTLYLLHGIFGNYTDWINGTRLQRWAEDHDLAVIMPCGENKFYVDNEKTLEFHSRFVGEELVEITRQLFPLSKKREDTFIGGLSMGGYGAVINGLKYHKTFGTIIGLSSAFILDMLPLSNDDEGTEYLYRRCYLESIFGDFDKVKGSDKDYCALVKKIKENKGKFPDIYLACGSEDFLIKENRAYRDFLKENKVKFTYVESPGVHNWDFWDEHILKAIEYLNLKQNKGTNSGNVK